MTNRNVDYRASRKKQIIYFVIWLVIELILMAALLPIDTLIKFTFFGVMTLALGLLLARTSKNAATDVMCPHCNADLFMVIEASNLNKVKINYCPDCGNEIEI